MNEARLKAQIQQAINKFPTSVDLTRKANKSSTLGGVSQGPPYIVGNYTGYLDIGSNYANLVKVGQANSRVGRNYSMLFISDVPAKVGDTFEANGKQFEIINIDPVSTIAITCDLAVI